MLTQHVTAGGNWDNWSGQLQALGAAGDVAGSTTALGYTENVIQQQALTLATNDVHLLYALVMICCIPLLWLARPPFQSKGSASAH